MCDYYLRSSYLEIGSVAETLVQLTHWRKNLSDKAGEEVMQKCAFQEKCNPGLTLLGVLAHELHQTKVLGCYVMFSISQPWATGGPWEGLGQIFQEPPCKVVPISQGWASREECRFEPLVTNTEKAEAWVNQTCKGDLGGHQQHLL